MNVLKRFLIALTATLLILTSSGCSQNAPVASQAATADTVKFTDSAGREVTIPRDITRIAPTGSLGQIVLYTLCPDKMVGWALEFRDIEREYIEEKYTKLPVFGNFYGDTLNLESVMAAAPQIIIDIGELKGTTKEDVDSIQEKTGIPTIFVHMDMETMSNAYITLGELTGEAEQAKKLSDYITSTLSEVKEKAAGIAESNRVTVYYGQDEGLSALAKGTIHTEIIDIAGGLNVADMGESAPNGQAEISMEQLLLWNPEVIIFSPGAAYGFVGTAPEWQEVGAIKSKRYYEVPVGPYNWMGRPPSVNRIIGIKWLANLLYPDTFGYDIIKEAQEFYKLFYHCDITEEQLSAILSKS